MPQDFKSQARSGEFNFSNGATYTGQSVAIDGERAVNLFPEKVESGHSKNLTGYITVGTPGLKLLGTLPDSPGRGLFPGDNRLFAAAGSHVYEMDIRTGAVLKSASIGFATTPVDMFANTSDQSNQIFIVSGTQGYIWDGANITPVVAAVRGAFLNGYFIAQQPDSNRFNISSINQGLTWDAADYATKEGAPDRLVAMVADHELLWLFGRGTTEVWYDAGAAPPAFPFSRYQAAFVEQGCWASWSVVKLDNSMFWLGGDARGAGVVWRAVGFSPARVSNHALEYAIKTYAEKFTIADAIGYGYQEDGHSFYVLHFPSADKTWAFDVATGMWHERESWDLVHGIPHATFGRFHAYTAERHFVQDYRNGKVYTASTSYYDDAGNPIRRLRSAPHISNELKRMRHKRLQLDMQVGGASALVDAQGQPRAPQMMMQFSDDGGFTWKNERWASAGKPGDYKARVIWRRLGASRDRCYRVISSEPIQHVWVDAYLDVMPGTGT